MAMTNHATELLPTTTVAEELGITVRQVYALIDAGLLKPTVTTMDGRRGRWVQIERSEFDRYRNSLTHR